MHLLQLAGISFMAFEASRKELELNPAADDAVEVQPSFRQRVGAKTRGLISRSFPFRSHHTKQLQRN